MASKYKGPADRIELYEALVAAFPGVERKGATMPYTWRNGHMTSFLDATGPMGLRLPEDKRDTFIAKNDTAIAEQHGRNMPAFVVVPDDLLERTKELKPWVAKSYEWVGTLKPN